jgi:uncharacterized membrane protein YfcA
MYELELIAAALFGSTLAAVTGFGGAAVLLPFLVHLFGVREAIPILTVAQLIGNGSRAYFNWKEIDRKIVFRFAVGAVPAALIGGIMFSQAPMKILMRILGVFLLTTLVWRRLVRKKLPKIKLNSFIGVGGIFGFLSALVGGVGPFLVPFFLSFGLVKGAFIGTEALCTVITHVNKIIAYHQYDLMGFQVVKTGVMLGCFMILGSWLGKKILNRLPEKVFLNLVEIVLLIAGLNFLVRG